MSLARRRCLRSAGALLLALGLSGSRVLAEEAPPELLPPVGSAVPARPAETPSDGPVVKHFEFDVEVNPDSGETKLIDLEIDGKKVSIDLSDYMPRHRPGAIWPQRAFAYAFIPRLGHDGMGINDIEFPAAHPTYRAARNPSGFHGGIGSAIHLFDGPGAFPIPAHVFDLYFELAFIRTIGDRWSIDLATAPGIYSDFSNGDDDRFRIPSRALAAFESSTGVKWVAGFLYLDWGTLKVLPVGGVIIQPHDRLRCELVAPRPRIAWRHSCESDSWWHAGVEYSGNSWGVERSESFNDQLTYSDFRATLGWQRCNEEGSRNDLEIGYVFSRELEYKSDGAAFYPNDSIMLRWTTLY